MAKKREEEDAALLQTPGPGNARGQPHQPPPPPRRPPVVGQVQQHQPEQPPQTPGPGNARGEQQQQLQQPPPPPRRPPTVGQEQEEQTPRPGALPGRGEMDRPPARNQTPGANAEQTPGLGVSRTSGEGQGGRTNSSAPAPPQELGARPKFRPTPRATRASVGTQVGTNNVRRFWDLPPGPGKFGERPVCMVVPMKRRPPSADDRPTTPPGFQRWDAITQRRWREAQRMGSQEAADMVLATTVSRGMGRGERRRRLQY